MHRLAGLAAALFAIPLSPAYALCIYRGVDNVRTTLDQEYRDSRWVVRARLVSADSRWSDEGESWTLYRLAVVRAYNGAPPRLFTLFTARDSGGFYMDRERGLPDLGGAYLLFLKPLPRRRGDPPAARGAAFVNYNCGQSGPWARVTPAERERLDALSGRR
jgi:hypothetical protein